MDGTTAPLRELIMNRETVKNVERAGFAALRVDDLWGDIVKRIEAEKPLPKAVE